MLSLDVSLFEVVTLLGTAEVLALLAVLGLLAPRLRPRGPLRLGTVAGPAAGDPARSTPEQVRPPRPLDRPAAEVVEVAGSSSGGR